VLRHSGIPETSILSIRAGGTRRQAQISNLDRPLKFACGKEECTTFKIDVLDLVGTARFAYDPEQPEYSVHLESPLEGGGNTTMEVAFAVRGAGMGNTVQSETDQDDDKALDKKKEVAAREYLDKHGLTVFMQFLMQSLMKDKPSDPYSYLQKQVTKRMVSELSKSITGDRADLPDDGNLESLLSKVYQKDMPSDVTTEQLEALEREAAAAGEQLRADNERLRSTAAELKARYGTLVEETATLNNQSGYVDEKAGASPLPPPGSDETPHLVAYREIAHIQDEVSALAKENSALVQQLSSMRSSIEAVRGEIDDMKVT